MTWFLNFKITIKEFLYNRMKLQTNYSKYIGSKQEGTCIFNGNEKHANWYKNLRDRRI